jgi:hypothetical protein
MITKTRREDNRLRGKYRIIILKSISYLVYVPDQQLY